MLHEVLSGRKQEQEEKKSRKFQSKARLEVH